MNRLNIFIVLIFFSVSLNAQVSEHYFTDEEPKTEGKIVSHIKYQNNIIIGGNSFDNARFNPVLLRIDTTGKILWKTTSNDNKSYNSSRVYIHKFFIGLDSFIYASCYDESNKEKEVWKVNPKNGNIIWKKTLTNTYLHHAPRFIMDFDSSKFLISYSVSYNSSSYYTRLAFMSKLTGDTLNSVFLGNMPWQNPRYGLCIDDKKDIYYSCYDTLYKMSGKSPNKIIWKKTHSSAQVSDYHYIWYDTQSKLLYFIGKRNTGTAYGKIVKINSVDGALISTSNAINSDDVEYQDMKVDNGSLNIIWRHITVGGSPRTFSATKYTMSNAQIEWNITYYLPNKGGGSQSAISLDIDKKGDVYMTGYCGDDNFSGSMWGIVKLNGKNGNTIYHKIIAEDSTKLDKMSVGMASCIINEKSYYVGQLQSRLQLDYQTSGIVMIKLEPNTGDELLRKSFNGNYKFPSVTLNIMKYPGSKTIVMKQVGRMIKFEMYDSSKNLLWEKFYKKKYFVFGVNLAIDPKGTIVFTACTKLETNTPPYVRSYNDSIYVVQLDKNGNLVKEHMFYSGLSNLLPVELQVDNSFILVFYQNSDVIYYRKISSSGISTEYKIDLRYKLIPSMQKYCYNKNESKAYIFGFISGVTKMIEIDKKMLVTKNLSILPNVFNAINFVQEIDSNLVVLCSNNILKNETIGIYNISTKDTLWTKKVSESNSTVLKCVLDSAKKHLYSISQNGLDIIIRKRLVSNGQQVWFYKYNGLSGKENAPTDISYNKSKGRIVVSGYETNSKNYKQPLTLILDTAGVLINSVSSIPDFSGDNIAKCTYVFKDGTSWVGGNLNKNSFGLAGFIFEFSDKTNSNIKDRTQILNCKPIAYPNPLSKKEILKITTCPNLNNSTLILINAYGKIIFEKNLNDINGTENMGEELNSGIYYYQIISNKIIYNTGKLLITD